MLPTTAAMEGISSPPMGWVTSACRRAGQGGQARRAGRHWDGQESGVEAVASASCSPRAAALVGAAWHCLRPPGAPPSAPAQPTSPALLTPNTMKGRAPMGGARVGIGSDSLTLQPSSLAFTCGHCSAAATEQRRQGRQGRQGKAGRAKQAGQAGQAGLVDPLMACLPSRTPQSPPPLHCGIHLHGHVGAVCRGRQRGNRHAAASRHG